MDLYYVHVGYHVALGFLYASIVPSIVPRLHPQEGFIFFTHSSYFGGFIDKLSNTFAINSRNLCLKNLKSCKCENDLDITAFHRNMC